MALIWGQLICIVLRKSDDFMFTTSKESIFWIFINVLKKILLGLKNFTPWMLNSNNQWNFARQKSSPFAKKRLSNVTKEMQAYIRKTVLEPKMLKLEAIIVDRQQAFVA